jgi:hypothetical protein
MLPTVFVLGATKAGSTTLTDVLWRHAAHVEPLAKELMYLQQLPEFESNYEANWLTALLWGRYANGHAAYSLAGYRKFFPTTRAAMKRRQAVGAAFTSECDPFNLYCPVALQRIHSWAVNPKFVISFRDPIARAYSDYQMHRRLGGERRSFEECVREERSGRETRFRKRFLNQSVYAPHVRRWLEAFPRDAFLFLKAEDLFADGATVARTLFQFLGLEANDSQVRPTNVGRYDAPLADRTHDELREYFAPHNRELFRMIGRDLGW